MKKKQRDRVAEELEFISSFFGDDCCLENGFSEPEDPETLVQGLDDWKTVREIALAEGNDEDVSWANRNITRIRQQMRRMATA